MQKILVTGSSGFIGFHLSKLLLSEGISVHGYDGMTDYYDVTLKRDRCQILEQSENFSFTEGMLEDEPLIQSVVKDFAPECIVHLAAQAGVRYSLEQPQAYIQSNVVGTMNVLEAARIASVKHLLMASTSSVYGANLNMPFKEIEKADTQMTIYAATKKANESMAHAYSHLWKIPTTMFRFFTVYGPWGRPDMALFKFADAILDGRAIDIYNNGDMYRDFTYVTDLVRGIRLLIDVVPQVAEDRQQIASNDSLSAAAPYRVVNIGNSEKIRLLDFVAAIEESLGLEAVRNYLPMQKGDVPATWADASLLKELTGYKPETSYKQGITQFVAWFRDYYGK